MAAKEKRGLGTGLGILFGEESGDANELKLLPTAALEPRRSQPRTVFDDDALLELADSVKRYGVIQPVTVRLLPSGVYQIVAGERRWRAARLAGLNEIPARLVEADDRLAAELALVENLQREDLNPMEEARGYRALMDDYGLTQEETAQSVGRSRPAVANSLRLLSLSPDVAALVEKGSLSAGHARALLPLSDGPTQLAAAEDVIQRSLSVRKTEQLASRMAKDAEERKKDIPSGDGIDYGSVVSEELSSLFGRRVRLVEGSRSGRIELSYYGSDDREVLIDELRKLHSLKNDHR